MKHSLAFISVVLGICCSPPLYVFVRSAAWSANDGFVENRDADGTLSEDIPYFTHLDGATVYFTRSGPLFRVQGSKLSSEDGENGEGHGEEHDVITVDRQFAVRFSGSQGPSRFEVHGSRADHVIRHGHVRSARFDTLTYRNVWPGIHVKYTLPKEGGLKYTVILDAGSDLDHVRFDLRESKAVVPTENGLLIVSDLGVWLEHPPVTFDPSGSIKSSRHVMIGDMLTFTVDDYKAGEALVIDPWIQTIPPITSYASLPAPYDSVFAGILGDYTGTGLNNAFNRVQIDHDRFGNVYVSQIPCLFYNVVGFNSTFPDFYVVGRFIHKFDANGNLLFTVDLGYEEIMTTDITVNRNTGDFFSVRQWEELLYFDPFGNLLSTLDIDPLPDVPEEINSIQYDHCQDQVVLGFGASFDSPEHFMGTTTPTNTGTVTPYYEYDFSTSDPLAIPYNDNVDVLIDPYSGDYFWLFLLKSDLLQEERALVKTDAPTITSQWQINGLFLDFTELRMHSVGVVNGPGRNHFEALACGRNFLYTTNGQQLRRWNKATGAVLNTVTIPIGGIFQNRAEGIDVDMCGRVYVGSNEQVAVYDSLLNFIQNLPLQDMPQDIIAFGNKLYVATDLELEALDLPPNLAPWALDQQPDSCNLCIGQASISFCAPATDIQVEWLTTGDTTLTTSGLCAGWHSVKIKETRNCVVQEYVDSVEVTTLTTLCAFNLQVPSDTICIGDCTDLVVQVSGQVAPVSYAWSNGTTTTSDSLTVCPVTTTTYEVIATDGTGALDTAQVTVFVVPPPTVDLGNDTTLCPGDDLLLDAQNAGTSFLWQDGSAQQNLLVNSSGTYVVTVDNGGCIALDSINVSFSGISVDLGPDTVFCAGDSLVLTSLSGPAQYLWSIGSTANAITIADPGTYWLTVTDGLCIATDTILVEQVDVNAQFAYSDTTGCSAPEVVFTDLSVSSNDAIVSWQWDFGDGSGSTQQAPTHVFAASGTYPVTLITNTAFGCSDTLSTLVNVVIFDVPVAAFTVDPSDPLAEEVVLFLDASIGAASWSWDFGDGDGSQDQDPQHTYLEGGSYSVELVVSNGNCNDTITVLLVVSEDLLFYVPNAFTPNGDGVNPVFLPVFSSGIDINSYELTIFDRWGELIHTSIDPMQGWDGTYQGTDVQDGVYVWQIRVKEVEGPERLKFVGHVTLLR